MSNVRLNSRSGKPPSPLLENRIDMPVLIVEDQAALATMLAGQLVDRWQAEVHIAKDYSEAKQYLKKHRHEYLVAICDLNLPDAPDGEVIDLVHRAGVSIISMTGSFGKDDKKNLTNKGVVDYVLKESLNAFSYVVDLTGRLYKNQFIEVLIVDDSPSVKALLTNMLELQKFVVHGTNSGSEALEVLSENNRIRVLISDYNMPDMNGFELCLSARELHDKGQLAIIGVSATDNKDLGAMFIKNGANDFLNKPFSYDELLCRINQNMDVLEYIDTINNIANRDYLTSLYNRRYFFETGQAHYDAFKSKLDSKEANTLSVAMFDIDFFKSVNDTFGHDGGDEVLKNFSKLMEQHFGEHLFARLGGEEFAIMFVDVDPAEAFRQLDAFRLDLEGFESCWGGHCIRVTTSIGVCTDLLTSFDAMMQSADTNLYKAKKQGRNKIVSVC